MNKIKLSREQVLTLIEDAVHHESDTSYRHGSYETYVGLHTDGKYYEFTLCASPVNGFDIEDETEAFEVTAKEVVTTTWVIIE